FRWLTSFIQDLAVYKSRFTLTAGGMLKEKYSSSNVPIVETIPRLNWDELSIAGDPTKISLQSTINLLFVGYLIPRKGAAYLIRAFGLLKEMRPGVDFRLTIVGAG